MCFRNFEIRPLHAPKHFDVASFEQSRKAQCDNIRLQTDILYIVHRINP